MKGHQTLFVYFVLGSLGTACGSPPAAQRPAPSAVPTKEAGVSKKAGEKEQDAEKKSDENESKESKRGGAEVEREEQKKQEKETQETIPQNSMSKKFVRVNDTLHFRKVPSLSSEIQGFCSPDTWVEIVAREGEWSKVTAGGKSGYMSSKYLFDSAKTADKGECVPF